MKRTRKSLSKANGHAEIDEHEAQPEDHQEEEEEEFQPLKKRKRPSSNGGSRFIASQAEENGHDDDDDDEEEEENGVGSEEEGDDENDLELEENSPPIKKRKRSDGTSAVKKTNKRMSLSQPNPSLSQTSSSSSSSSSGSSSRRRLPPPVSADGYNWNHSGVIKSIVLENFMCHSHLRTDFCPNVNFLTGPNGSGKSAILVALSIGLGASPRFTNRAPKLSNLIKVNSDTAKISITLSNTGLDAFRYEEYGHEITIERTIRQKGSTYRILNHLGKVVKQSKQELDQILESFNIQVNNPCSVLMQDTSRAYLAESTPATKYKFFMSATQLDQILEDLRTTHGYLDKIKRCVTVKSQSLKVIEDRTKRLRLEKEQFTKFQDLKQRISQLRDEMAWAHVTKIEQTIKKFEEQIKKFETAETKVLQEVDTLNGKVSEIEDKKSALLDQHRIAAANQPQAPHEIAQELRDQQKSQRDANDRVENLRQKQGDFQSRLNNLQQRLNRERQTDRRSDLENLNRDLALKRQELQRQDAELMTRSAEFERAKTERIDVKNALDEANAQTQQVQKQLERLNDQAKNRELAFGPNVPRIKAMIQQSISRFSVPPVGPLGLFLNITDDQWAIPINEAIGGGMMRTYIVDNHNDERILSELGRTCGERSMRLIIRKLNRPRYNVSADKPRGYTTAEDVVEVSNDDVYNALIDHTQFHTAIMGRDFDYGKEAIRSLPPGYRVFFRDGSKLWKTNGGVENSVPPSGGAKSPMLGGDPQQQIANLRATLPGLQRNTQNITEQYRQIERLVVETKRQCDTITRTKRALESKIREMEERGEDLKKTIEAEVTMFDTSKIEKLEQKIEKTQQEIDAEVQAKSVVENRIRQLQRQIDSYREKQEQFQAQMDILENQMQNLEIEKKSVTLKIAARQEQLSMMRAHQKTVQPEASLAKSQAELQAHTEAAQRICEERVHSKYSLEKLDELLTKENQRYKQQTEGCRPEAEVTKELETELRKFTTTKQEITHLDVFAQTLGEILRNRSRKWKKQRKEITKMTDNYFQAFLNRKGFTGKLLFNTEDETLDIRVKLSDASEGQTAQSLSGGERSFSTVSLLLALWQSMDNPFYALDEYDVFMDQVNRQKSTQMLLEISKYMCSHQFIFITPQSLGQVDENMGGEEWPIKIIRMRPPRDNIAR